MSQQSKMIPSPNQADGWRSTQSLQSELNHVLDLFKTVPFGLGQEAVLAIDIAETDGAIEITVEIPGVKSEDLDISISNETLILKGQKSDTREDSGTYWRHVERSFGSFSRQISLGFAPKDGQVDVEFLEGVLTLRIAKPAGAPAASRKIDISTS